MVSIKIIHFCLCRPISWATLMSEAHAHTNHTHSNPVELIAVCVCVHVPLFAANGLVSVSLSITLSRLQINFICSEPCDLLINLIAIRAHTNFTYMSLPELVAYVQMDGDCLLPTPHPPSP